MNLFPEKNHKKTYERWHLNAKALKKVLGAKKGYNSTFMITITHYNVHKVQ